MVSAITISSCSLLFTAADFEDLGAFPWPTETPIKEPETGELNVLFEDVGTFAVLHGFSCAKSDREGREDFVRIQEQVKLRDFLDGNVGWATNATVFLNGWYLEFLEDKHELIGFSTAIARIKFERLELEWQAGGAFADDGFDSGYRLCYTYTILVWNDDELDMGIDDSDDENIFLALETFNQSKTARHVLRNYRQDLPFINVTDPAGVLPRGYGMSWRQSHQVLQAAYSMGASEKVVIKGADYGELESPNLNADTMRYGDGAISWDSSLILRDNGNRHDFYAAEIVSVLGGSSIHILHPPYGMSLRDNIDDDCGGIFTGCITTGDGNPGLLTRDITVENLPFEIAVPLLKGWSLGYANDDHTLRELGARISTFNYEIDPSTSLGTLHYSVEMIADNRQGDEPFLDHSIAVLGLNSVPNPVGGGGGIITDPVKEAPTPGPATDE